MSDIILTYVTNRYLGTGIFHFFHMSKIMDYVFVHVLNTRQYGRFVFQQNSVKLRLMENANAMTVDELNKEKSKTVDAVENKKRRNE